MSVSVHGYGADAELVDSTLRLTATGRVGRGALGAAERDIAVGELVALSFRPANMMINGRLELVDHRGKSVLHFRRKGNDQWRSLYEKLVKLAPSGADEVPTDDAPLFSEDAQAVIAWLGRKAAEAEAKKAAKQAAKEAKSAPLTEAHASPSQPAAAGSGDAADQLRKLAQLRDEGLVTEAEFEAKRAELIARM